MTTSTYDRDILQFRQDLGSALQQIITTHQIRDTSGVQLAEPARLGEALNQFLAILDSIENHAEPVSSDHEINNEQIDPSELGDYGLGLFSQLGDWSGILQLDTVSETIYQATLSLSLWIARHGWKIGSLEQLVNSISYLANRTREPADLEMLATVIEEIIEAIDPMIKVDKQGEPWQILNLNYGIVATRSQNPGIMEAVFEKLLFRIPAAAAGFFAEGMEQMDIVGYPDPVRRIMEKYYRQTQHRVLH